MSPSILFTYDCWDLKPPEILSRSYLHSLKPIGVGTSKVESLTSYISRLADSHTCTTSNLVMNQIVPLINELFERQYKKDSNRLFSTFVDRNSGALNGLGLIANSFVLALSQLTLCSELKFLTLLNWHNIFANRGLLRHHSAWCPICLEDWKSNNQIIYEPLIWKFTVLTICPEHQIFLSTICLNCQQNIPQLSSRSQPGYCPKCYQWLGIKKDLNLHIEKEHNIKYELTWQAFVAKNVGEVLAKTPTLSPIPTREHVYQNLKKCIDVSTGGNRHAFAKLLCMTTSAVWDWYEGNSLPQILVLLRICYCLNISLINFLNGNLSGLDSNHLNSLLPNQYSKTTCHFPVNKIQVLLSTYLDLEPPIPMEAVAQKLQQDKRYLYRYFPDTCMKIASRYKKYRNELSRQRMEKLCLQAGSAATELAALGVYPSDAKVQAHLNWRGHMKNKQIRDYLAQVRLELGFDK